MNARAPQDVVDDRATQALVAELRSAMEGLPLRVAILFGSCSRGTAAASSDVDIAVSGKAVDTLGLAAHLSERVHREVDVVLLADATIPMLEALIRDGRVIFEGEAGAGALWRSATLAQLETDGPWYRRMRDAWLARVARDGVEP